MKSCLFKLTVFLIFNYFIFFTIFLIFNKITIIFYIICRKNLFEQYNIKKIPVLINTFGIVFCIIYITNSTFLK